MNHLKTFIIALWGIKKEPDRRAVRSVNVTGSVIAEYCLYLCYDVLLLVVVLSRVN